MASPVQRLQTVVVVWLLVEVVVLVVMVVSVDFST